MRNKIILGWKKALQPNTNSSHIEWYKNNMVQRLDRMRDKV